MIRVCTLEMYPSEHARRTSTRQTWGISPWGTRKYIRGASLRGRLRPPATLAHKQEFNKMPMTTSHREVHGFRCKLATCKCQALHGPQKLPGRRMYGRNRKDGEKEQCTGKPFAQHTSNTVLGRANNDFFIRFDNTASCIYARCSTTCWRKPTPSACLRCRALIGAYLLCCLLRWLTALCCTVLCLRYAVVVVDIRRQHARIIYIHTRFPFGMCAT